MIVDRMRRARQDEGFALIFTLFVTTMVMIAVAATLTITTPNIVGSKRSQDAAAALLAAESGIQDAIAYLTNTPACRSETRICPQALGADSAAPGMNRPTLGGNQSFHWTTASSPVPLTNSSGAVINPDGFVRVTSTGTEAGTSRTLVADLSLNPSILAYGYYTDYESQSPTFFNSYYGPRNIDVTNAQTYGYANQVNTSGYSVPQTISWNGAANPPSGYSDSVCAQHWYSDGSNSPGRANASHGSTWYESGTLDGQNVYHGSSCDLVFTSGMTENGPTYTRDALDIAKGSGSGPVFNQPVYTLWGYGNNTSPAPPAGQPWRQSDGQGNDTLSNSPYKPQIATQDITLPTNIGSAGVETNSCVYYGPTRAYLNGNGTATITSPATTASLAANAIAAGADANCYPSTIGSNGIVGALVNYANAGSGTIYVKNLSTPSSGTWPLTTIKSTSTPSANNEVFYIPPTTTGATAPDQPNSSSAPDNCSGSAFSVAANSPCAWSGVATPTDAGPYGSYAWKSYSSASCGSATDSNRQLFECDYQHLTGTANPTVSQSGGSYAKVRAAVQADLAAGTCISPPNGGSVINCLAGIVNNDLTAADTAAHRYVVTNAGTSTATTSTQNVGATPSSPVAGDSLFTTVAGSPAQETVTRTPYILVVARQTSTDGGKTWTTGSYQFLLTATLSSWAITSPASGGQSYFPNPQDVTQYATGANSSGNAAGSAGSSQPGDLYVEGVNQGSLSLIAQNNVEITGNITKGAGNDSSTANPVSITAGGDVRNYHPVSCADQTPADINATSPGWCPNDITGATSYSLLNSDGSFMAQNPAAQYVDMPTSSSNSSGIGNRTVDAAVFALTGSLRTDNYDRGNFVGNLVINGGIYQSHRGANGVSYANGSNPVGRSGTSLNYNYVDLERANLQYVPSANYSSNPRVWNVVSVSDAANPPASAGT